MTVPPFPGYLLRLVGFCAVDSAAGVALVDPPVGTVTTTNPTFVHWCRPTAEPGRFVLTNTPLHTVVSRAPWHLEASLLCGDCGFHGWIRDGAWVPA